MSEVYTQNSKKNDQGHSGVGVQEDQTQVDRAEVYQGIPRSITFISSKVLATLSPLRSTRPSSSQTTPKVEIEALLANWMDQMMIHVQCLGHFSRKILRLWKQIATIHGGSPLHTLSLLLAAPEGQGTR